MEENKELDDFIRKSIKAVGLEKPSVDFTDSVLAKIEEVNQKDTVSATKPLFSKLVWFFLVSAVVSVFGYVIFNSSSTESTWLAAVRLNKLTSFNLSLNIPEFSLPVAFIYGSVAVAIFVWIQVFILKQRLNKRYVTG